MIKEKLVMRNTNSSRATVSVYYSVIKAPLRVFCDSFSLSELYIIFHTIRNTVLDTAIHIYVCFEFNEIHILKSEVSRVNFWYFLFYGIGSFDLNLPPQ
jgi:hypothetical protein